MLQGIDSIQVTEITETTVSGTAVEKGRIQIIANGKTIGRDSLKSFFFYNTF